MYRLVVLTALVCTLIACSNTTKTQPIPQDTVPIHLVVIDGEYGVNIEQAIEVFNVAKETIERDISINLQIYRIDEMTNPTPEVQEQSALFEIWYDWAVVSELLSKDRIIAVILPPYQMNSKLLFGGAANSICGFGRRESFVISTAGPWSSHIPAKERLLKSGKTLAHELSHVLGADHDHSNSLMAESFDGEVNPNLGLSQKSIQEINSCLY